MNQPLATLPELEQDRQQRLAELNADLNANWEQQYHPGSFGCHELLDRTSLLADSVEQRLMSHPACVLHAEWYALAGQAVAALRELYQHIGAEHIDSGDRLLEK